MDNMILITGWTGNTGSFVVKYIINKFPNKKIVCISRKINYRPIEGVIVEIGDLNDERKIRDVFKKYRFELIINIANIRYSPLLIKLANAYHIPHAILVHTTGIYSKYSIYSSLYKEIEELIFKNQYINTSFTILRPTMIYGNIKDYNMHKLIRFLSRSPVFPIFGDGSALMQPIHVEDLANAIVNCINNKKVKNMEYDLSGGSVETYKNILKIITRLLRKKVVFVHIPIKLSIGLIKLLNKITKEQIISVEQIERLLENKAYPHNKATMDLNHQPRTFIEGITQEITEMQSEGII